MKIRVIFLFLIIYPHIFFAMNNDGEIINIFFENPIDNACLLVKLNEKMRINLKFNTNRVVPYVRWKLLTPSTKVKLLHSGFENDTRSSLMGANSSGTSFFIFKALACGEERLTFEKSINLKKRIKELNLTVIENK